MRAQERHDAGPEPVLAEVAAQHVQQRGGLAVGQRVEHGLRLRGGTDLALDRLRGGLLVGLHGGRPFHQELVPALPFRPPRGDRAVGHERGEPFLEPQLVPPRHGHQVPEPQVGEFVGEDVGDAAHRRLVRVGLPHQQVGLGEHQGTEVFTPGFVAGLAGDDGRDDAWRAYIRTKYRDLQTYNCWHEDRTAAGNSIENRVPFLDHRLVREILRVGRVGRNESYGRVDAFETAGGIRAVEINTGSVIAEYKKTKLNDLLLRTPHFAEFAREFGLAHVDTIARLAGEVRDVASEVVGCEHPTVAIVEETGCVGLCEWMAPEFRERGFRAVYGELEDVDSSGDKVLVKGVPVDVVLRKFFVRHILAEKNGMEKLEILRRGHLSGKTAWFTSFDSEMHGSKAALGLLYEPAVSAVLSPAERDLVARRIPWTRRAGRGFDFTGTKDRLALLDEVRARRADLVLKPAAASGGNGVVFGDEVTDREWAALVADPDRGDNVVQERLRPSPQYVIDPERRVREPWNVLWQVFFDSHGYAGLAPRGRRESDPGVIGGGNPGTQSGCAFTYATASSASPPPTPHNRAARRDR
ncbi:hypothetical protein AOZ06_26560 [Kibdelosporangium phytohabitans]|uniref:Asparagine synthetase domain-containing protein n=1 Tax=Kibdelosporangium phytohabitans TaxID=860235 RepID=A0A0N9I2Y1_9PSEU|nr:asparagine synthase-related protein [Kibdelosporangium phytohabitans]ALG09988.1 hypothetical protein AOZ06_26560 [Kibdelosporangium phytohabitans]